MLIILASNYHITFHDVHHLSLDLFLFFSFADINETTIEHFIRLCEPQLQFHTDLSKNYKLLQALLELNVQNDEEFDLLSDKYKTLLTNKQTIEQSNNNEASNFKRLKGIVIDLFIDKFKFKGINVKHKLEHLVEILDNYDFDSLLDYFNISTDVKHDN